MKRSLPALAIAAVVLAVAALGSSTTLAGYGGPAPSPAPSGTGSTSKVELVKTKLGKVLADGSGHTLYLFEKDKGPKSTCTAACASAWPPLTTTGKPKARRGVSTSKLGTTSRGGGVKQVTYNRHPLYRFVKDSGPRQTHGEGLMAFGAQWFAVSAAGSKKVAKGGS
jgi:predicted lipoprotein with Yx(FWY)xxD motif